MVPVGKVGPATVVGSGRASRRGSAAEAGAVSTQRALVRIAPIEPASGISVNPAGNVASRAADGRATAPFLAHLIATVQGAPQTRDKRRADPNRAITAYAAMMHVPESTGQEICESR
jgi:hypothetical protein